MKVATSAAVAILLAPSVLGQPVQNEGYEPQQEGLQPHHSKSAEGRGEYGAEPGYEGAPHHGGQGPHRGPPPESAKGTDCSIFDQN